MKSLRLWIAFTVFCIIAVPVAVFLGGLWLAGPYEGANGFFGMLGTIYSDALTGHPGAIGLLVSPVLIIGIWQLALSGRRLIPTGQGGSGSSAASKDEAGA